MYNMRIYIYICMYIVRLFLISLSRHRIFRSIVFLYFSALLLLLSRVSGRPPGDYWCVYARTQTCIIYIYTQHTTHTRHNIYARRVYRRVKIWKKKKQNGCPELRGRKGDHGGGEGKKHDRGPPRVHRTAAAHVTRCESGSLYVYAVTAAAC